ncbi:MAG: LysR family transcriptional regulator [Alphaproteobacteria bacterium]|nr:LysR family transcriptional regulator [Alphaproteobacteria bacterium]
MLDRLTLDQMRMLIAVAETGSFQAAARRLGRVQSAVSQAIQALEFTLGVTLFERTAKPYALTETGRVVLADARHVVRTADTMRVRAATVAGGLEPDLAIAVEAIFPSDVLMAGLQALAAAFPDLPVTLYTEGLGGPEQRLRDGTARWAIYATQLTGAVGLESEFLVSIPMVPVVAAGHALAALPSPLTREVLEPHLQLVLTDRTAVTAGLQGGIVGRHIWRFADLGLRLDYLLAGFGWCHMPQHLVAPHIAAGRLARLVLAENGPALRHFDLNVVHERGRLPGRAGAWLIAELRRRLAACGLPAEAVA